MTRPSQSIERPPTRNDVPDHVRAAFALDCACAAAQFALRQWRHPKPLVEIAKPGTDTDFATLVDKQAEALIRTRISERFPGEAFIGEETAPASPEEYRQAPECWLVDPIDGTTDYSRGRPDFGVLVGFLRGGRPEAAAIALPARNEYWAGARNHGTILNSTIMRTPRVSNTANPKQAVIGHNYGYSKDAKRKMAAVVMELIEGDFRGLITGTSASLLMEVALGRIDAVVCWGMPWDVAAGSLLVEMAGGRLTHHDGSAWSPFRPDYVASNGGPLHDKILELLNT